MDPPGRAEHATNNARAANAEPLTTRLRETATTMIFLINNARIEPHIGPVITLKGMRIRRQSLLRASAKTQHVHDLVARFEEQTSRRGRTGTSPGWRGNSDLQALRANETEHAHRPLARRCSTCEIVTKTTVFCHVTALAPPRQAHYNWCRRQRLRTIYSVFAHLEHHMRMSSPQARNPGQQFNITS